MNSSDFANPYEKKIYKKSFRLSDSNVKCIMKFATEDNPSIGAAFTNMLLLIDGNYTDALVKNRDLLLHEISTLTSQYLDLKQSIIIEIGKTKNSFHKTEEILDVLLLLMTQMIKE